jgi:hypothetical protein
MAILYLSFLSFVFGYSLKISAQLGKLRCSLLGLIADKVRGIACDNKLNRYLEAGQ